MILTSIEVPTGHILIVRGQNGDLECLSLADYGKDVNLNQHKAVVHQSTMPLTKKWVITISTQYGCSMGCRFCDVPKVGAGRNATYTDLLEQVYAARSLHPRIQTERLNIHYARMGEPTWNSSVLDATLTLAEEMENVHPVVSTMMPRYNTKIRDFLQQWLEIKNYVLGGNAGLQLSINSTDDAEREYMFSRNALCLEDIGYLMKALPAPKGRKITLNFAVADYKINPEVLLKHFSPDRYVVKLTPMHKTATAESNEIRTTGDYTQSYPYEEHEENLKKAGYEVLVFIASKEEDESRITCGNAILGDKNVLLSSVLNNPDSDRRTSVTERVKK